MRAKEVFWKISTTVCLPFFFQLGEKRYIVTFIGSQHLLGGDDLALN